MALTLLPLLYSHDNLTLKLHQKKIVTLLEGAFLQVDSKLELYQAWQIKNHWRNFYINFQNQLKTSLPSKIQIFFTLCILKKESEKKFKYF